MCANTESFADAIFVPYFMQTLLTNQALCSTNPTHTHKPTDIHTALENAHTAANSTEDVLRYANTNIDSAQCLVWRGMQKK